MATRLYSLLCLVAPLTLSCCLIGFDDLETQPCIAGPDRSIEAFTIGNALCAELEATTPTGDDEAWVCRLPIGDDLFCTISSPDADNDGAGAAVGPMPGLDCDDSDPAVFGGREESSCDGKDNDCDAMVDEGLYTAFEPVSIRAESVSRLAYGATDTVLASIGVGPLSGKAEVVVESSLRAADLDHRDGGFDVAVAPLDMSEAAYITHQLGADPSFSVRFTDDPTLPDGEVPPRAAAETAFGPELAVGSSTFLVAFYDAELSNCGSPASQQLRLTSGGLTRGLDQVLGATVDAGTVAGIRAPSILRLSEPNHFLVAASTGTGVTLVHVRNTAATPEVLGSATYEMGGDIFDFVVAGGESDEDGINLGVTAVVGCGTREVMHASLRYLFDDNGTMELGETVRIDDVVGVPSRVAAVWSNLPRGYNVAWFSGTEGRLRLVGETGVLAGESVPFVSGDQAGDSFPFGVRLAERDGGGVRIFAYGEGPTGTAPAGLYSIAVECASD